ncbi:MAG: hypothetical protein HY914_04030 [Desulfomonile tiedjei]|nr:hypothetical protein [Desulfomonile tiedjei]
MSLENGSKEPFSVKDCSLIAIATGDKAQNLRELREGLLKTHPGSVYYHFWGGRLRPAFADPQFHNDFATWCHYALHDDILAERLAVIDPTDYYTLDLLRQEVVEIIEQRLEDVEHPRWVELDQQFHFIRSQIVVFDTGRRIERPEELPEVVPRISVGSIFYHFVDARRRHPISLDDFRSWLRCSDEPDQELCYLLASVDPYFVTLKELREQLASIFEDYFKGRQQ